MKNGLEYAKRGLWDDAKASWLLVFNDSSYELKERTNATYNLGLFYEINNNFQLAENFYNDCYKMSGKSEYLDARVRVKKRKSEVQLLKEQTGFNDQ